MNLIPNVYDMQDSSLKTTTMKNEFDAINFLTCVHTFSKPFNNGLCVWQAYIMRDTCLLLEVFVFPYCFLVLHALLHTTNRPTLGVD